MTKLQQRYVKYLIKNPLLFYAFLGLLIAVFLGLSLTLKLDVVKSYPAEIEGSSVRIESSDSIPLAADKLYFYTSRNERIYKSNIKGNTFSDEKMLIELADSNDISGEVTVDLIVGKQTLLERIFVKAGKG